MGRTTWVLHVLYVMSFCEWGWQIVASMSLGWSRMESATAMVMEVTRYRSASCCSFVSCSALSILSGFPATTAVAGPSVLAPLVWAIRWNNSSTVVVNITFDMPMWKSSALTRFAGVPSGNLNASRCVMRMSAKLVLVFFALDFAFTTCLLWVL